MIQIFVQKHIIQHTPVYLAEYFISFGQEHSVDITHMSLQILVFEHNVLHIFFVTHILLEAVSPPPEKTCCFFKKFGEIFLIYRCNIMLWIRNQNSENDRQISPSKKDSKEERRRSMACFHSPWRISLETILVMPWKMHKFLKEHTSVHNPA